MLDFEGNGSRSVLPEFGAVCQHHGDRLAYIPYDFVRDHRLRIRGNRRIGTAKWNGRKRMTKSFRGEPRLHTGHRERRLRMGRAKSAVGDRAAHHHGMPEPLPMEIVDILSA